MTTSQLEGRKACAAPKKFDKDDEFYLPYKDRNYHNQFYQLYSQRLKDLRPRVLSYANEKWDNRKINGIQVHHTEKVLDIKTNEPCWVVGLVYCEMQYKPNILEDVAVGVYGTVPAPKPSYSDPDSNVILLEDESGRVQLNGDLVKSTMLVSGNVIGVIGIEIESGVFEVIDILYPSVAPQIPRTPRTNGNKIAFVSGLNIDPANYSPVKLELLKDFLLGQLGERQLASSISRLVIAGDSTKTLAYTHDGSEQKFYGTKSKSKYNSVAMGILDSFLAELLVSIPVDIMPGASDPAESIFPQQPIHSTLFKKTKNYLQPTENSNALFRTLTNPAWLEFDGARLLGTSGQNISDMFKYLIPNSTIENLELSQAEEDKLRMDIAEATINWQNIVPSSPDTLWTYPFQDRDPFTLTETPHVYFIGNQPLYEVRNLQLPAKDSQFITVKIISLPCFHTSGEVVLLDLDTFDSEIVKIT